MSEDVSVVSPKGFALVYCEFCGKLTFVQACNLPFYQSNLRR